MANRLGTCFSIALTIKDRAFDASTVNDLDMVIPMNGLPRGTFSVMVTDLSEYKVDSGCYGQFMFLNTGYPELDGKGFSFYVIKSSQTVVNEATTKLYVEWRCGSPDTLARKSMAITGTSLDAMIDVMKSYKEPVPYGNRLMDNASSLVDTMTWRYIQSNLEEMLVFTVNHSSMNGDYLYWYYDEVEQQIVFSSLGVSSKSSEKQALIYSQNALASTNNVMYTDPNSGSTVWMYAYQERSSSKGENLGETFPNVVFSDIKSDGKADVSNCNGECFDNVVTHYGAKSSEQARKEFNVTDKNATYGDLTIINNFPLNTHKSYPIAGMLRDRIISEYSKMMTIGIYNSIGPAVGSRVYVRALKLGEDFNSGGTDMYYTDEYIVLGKKIRKEGAMQTGALGNLTSNQSADYVTYVILGSKSHEADNYEPTMKELENIATACKVELEKKS